MSWLLKSLLATSSLVAITALDVRQASATITIDNIGSTPFGDLISTGARQLGPSNWVAKVFAAPTTIRLASIKLGLGVPGTTDAGRTLGIGLYAATNSGTPGIANTPPNPIGFRPTGSPLASAIYSAVFNSSGNQSQGGGYTTLSRAELGSLSTFSLLPGAPYALVFYSGTTDTLTIGWRNNGVYTESGIDFLNSTGTTNGSSLDPISLSSGQWQDPTTPNLATNALTFTFAEVPTPALAGLGSLAGLARYSRLLRRRIKAS